MCEGGVCEGGAHLGLCAWQGLLPNTGVGGLRHQCGAHVPISVLFCPRNVRQVLTLDEPCEQLVASVVDGPRRCGHPVPEAHHQGVRPQGTRVEQQRAVGSREQNPLPRALRCRQRIDERGAKGLQCKDSGARCGHHVAGSWRRHPREAQLLLQPKDRGVRVLLVQLWGGCCCCWRRGESC